MNGSGKRVVFGAALVVAASLPGCFFGSSRAANAPDLRAFVGEHVNVAFRRDAMGQAAPNAVHPDVTNRNGAQMNLSGTLTEIEGNWIRVEKTENQLRVDYWINLDTVILVSQHAPQ